VKADSNVRFEEKKMKSSTLRTLRTMLAPTTSPNGVLAFATAGSRRAGNQKKLGLLKMVCLVAFLCGTAISSPAQTFTSLLGFDGTNGANPHWVYLVQGTDGELYGTTAAGPPGDGGTVFKITTGGALTTLYKFCAQGGSPCPDGAQPNSGLVLATNGNFYGTTMNGGANESSCGNGCGTVYQITSGGKLTTLHSFEFSDGAAPEVGLIQAANGLLYGTTSSGGSGDVGTIFEIETGGSFTSLLSFDGVNGDYPNARLVQDSLGVLYGTAQERSSGAGSVFETNYFGQLNTLYTFHGPDGGGPTGALIQATDGNFYGTTQAGGPDSGGTVFKITPAGELTTLYNFCAQSECRDGSTPIGGLIQATDGNLYGTTYAGGANETSCNGGCGTIFKITTAGKLTTLYSFCAQAQCADGSAPPEGLVQHTNGSLYGVTYYGGPDGLGTIFSLSVGLAPSVKTVPTSANVGAKVTILGTLLNGATKVLFDGLAATFTVVSSTEITAIVPTGASTGNLTVVTPKGTLTSNVPFRVTPQITSFTPASGPVGTSVTITGVSLNQATAVTFGGVAATEFSVKSNTEVTATVPTGAVKGTITITTPEGTTASTTSFTVSE
jgi:uncharacterized repeat protein (TIGR03803 family)